VIEICVAMSKLEAKCPGQFMNANTYICGVHRGAHGASSGSACRLEMRNLARSFDGANKP
jgi:hypothetical protein